MTLGAGGHAEALLAAGVGRLVGVDRDPDALAVAGERLATVRRPVPAGPRPLLRGRRGRRRRSGRRRALRPRGLVDAARPARSGGSATGRTGRSTCGWATNGPTAADLVNELPEKELADLIFEFGQEHQSRRIAAAIVRARSRAPITGTDELAGIVVGAVGRRPGGPHPARRTFQALRIAVNREIEELAASLPQAVELLAPGGRVVVLAYHSLEDRIVKRTFRDDDRLLVLTKKPLQPSQAEIARTLARAARNCAPPNAWRRPRERPRA